MGTLFGTRRKRHVKPAINVWPHLCGIASVPRIVQRYLAERAKPCDIFVNIFMPTTVHIPDPLLKSVDRRAKALGISRNRLVVRALEQAVRERSGWTPEFLERLRRVDSETSAAADELLNAVKQARRSKEPQAL